MFNGVLFGHLDGIFSWHGHASLMPFSCLHGKFPVGLGKLCFSSWLLYWLLLLLILLLRNAVRHSLLVLLKLIVLV